MRADLDCILNGTPFTAIDPRLYIQQIEESVRVSNMPVARSEYGLRLIRDPKHQEISVVLTFLIKEKDRVIRHSIIRAVNAWARKGWLTLSSRPGQRLYVVCTQPAGPGLLRWYEELQLVMTAYGEAYWQESIPATASMTGSSGTIMLHPMGNRECFLEADITNMSNQMVDTLSLAANEQTLVFTELGLTSGKTLHVYYDEAHILHAEMESESMLHCRTAESDDEIILQPAANAVTFNADQACSVILHACGMWE